MFLCILDSLGLVSTSRYGCMTATLSWKQLLARLFRTVDGCCWVTLVSDSSELTARHLPISKGNKLDASFICCTKFPWPTTASMILNVACFFVLLQKSLNITSWNLSLLWNLHLGETWLIQNNYPVSCRCSQSCHDKTIFHNLILVAEFGCSSPSFKPPTQLLLWQFITVLSLCVTSTIIITCLV